MEFSFFMGVFGGLAVFLFGMKMMSQSLQKLAGNELRRILKMLTDTPLKGVFVGTAVTAVIQSSSATTVMLVGFVNAGLMTLKQVIGVVMGANIGTTITAQIIAFKVSNYFYPMLIIGIIMLFWNKNRKMELWGKILIGFGFLFLGLSVMSSMLKPLKDSDAARHLFVSLSHYPVFGILAGTLVTVVVQSSSASMGLVIVLANNGLIDFNGAIYLVLGDNIGTTITAWLASLAADRSAKRVSLVHSLFNVFGSIIFGTLTYLGLYNQFIDWITPGQVNTESIARHIANSHSFYNILNTLLFLPFVGVLERTALKILPTDELEQIPHGEPRYINYQMLNTPQVAIEQAIFELKEMLILSEMAVNKAINAYLKKKTKKFKIVDQLESAIDNLQKEITLFLVALSSKNIGEENYMKIPPLLHSINDIERIGDRAVNLKEIFLMLLNKKNEHLNCFNDDVLRVQSQLNEMYKNVYMYLQSSDSQYSLKVREIEGGINEMQVALKNKAIDFIQAGKCDARIGLNITNFIDNMERIADHLKNIVKAASKHFEYRNIKKGKVMKLKTETKS